MLGDIPESTEIKQLIIEGVSASLSLEHTEYRSMNLVISATELDFSILPKLIQKQLSSNPLSEADRNLSPEEKLQTARTLLFNEEYQKRKGIIWKDVQLSMLKMLEEAKQQYLITSSFITMRYRHQILYLSLQTIILLSLLFYAFVINRLRLKYSKKLEEANAHLIHEAQLVAQQSELKLREAKLEAERDSAIKAEKARSFFFATVSHDIRTPLNSIIGFTDLLRKGTNTPEENKEYLDNISYSGGMLMELINDVLDLSKLEAGKMQFTYDYHDFADLIRSLIMVFKSQTDAKGLQLLTDIQKMPYLLIDLQRVRQILFNLIGNAVKFTSQGNITISASCSDSGPETKTLVFSVKDTGIGIAPENVKKLANPYMQFETKSSIKGTGLGLAICKQLLTKMNGSLDVTSVLGEGSTFTVTMKDLKYVVHETKRAEEAHDAVQLDDSVKDLSLLLVDDTPVNLSMLKAMCKNLGITKTFTAKDGHEALGTLRTDQKIDAVLTDIQMPGMDGLGLVAEIRKDVKLKELPVFAVTADVDILKTYQKDGFTGLLLKPFTLDKLTELFNGVSSKNDH